MTTPQLIALVIFAVTMLAIMTETIHRTVAAITGAILLVLTGILTIESSFTYVDINTLGVLIGMMIFVTIVKDSGLFEYIAILSAKLARGKPWAIMSMFMVITAVLSAFLDNVTTVLLIGPMTLAITSMLKVNPVPFFMTQILASNIGGTATLIGDPPNIMIGSAAGLSFMDFVCNTGLAVILVMAATILCFYYIYGRKLSADEDSIRVVMALDEKKAIKDKALLIKSVVMIGFVVLGFVFHSQLHLESCTIALTAAVVMLLIGKQELEETIAGVEWTTIIFFTGWFIVVGGLQETGLIQILADLLMEATSGRLALTLIIVLWVSALVSSFLDNIP
ncbi:MAG: ArsB/NhaD family transporter, partial [Ruminiclostridium sp.]|nr:ArsB/NhaD family transporter [Ruminiclostridium sp.]